MVGHAAQDAEDADRADALRAALLIGSLWAPKEAGKQVTAWLQAHGLAKDGHALAQDPADVWLATDEYWTMAELGAPDG